MKRIWITAAVLALVTSAGAKPKVKGTVAFAPSWKAAIEEAKLLNLPIVVHQHLFP